MDTSTTDFDFSSKYCNENQYLPIVNFVCLLHTIHSSTVITENRDYEYRGSSIDEDLIDGDKDLEVSENDFTFPNNYRKEGCDSVCIFFGTTDENIINSIERFSRHLKIRTIITKDGITCYDVSESSYLTVGAKGDVTRWMYSLMSEEQKARHRSIVV